MTQTAKAKINELNKVRFEERFRLLPERFGNWQGQEPADVPPEACSVENKPSFMAR